MNDAGTMNDEHPMLTQLIDLLADILVTSATGDGRVPPASTEPGPAPANKEADSDLAVKDNRGYHEQR